MITTTNPPPTGSAPQPPGCINLKQRFGDRYRVEYEESYRVERGENGRAEDPWLMILLCHHGHICPWGGTQLAACTRRPGQIVNRLKALQFTTAAQDGDDGANILFDVEHFDRVAEIMRPRRRRRMSEERRREAAERLRKYQPAKGQSVQDLVRQRAESALESPFATPVV
ncbi:MAG: hypothetical protein HQ582_28455 [Planctomycetes bacterium]|nr:hypothetical protein [Planctomycetota bacterium]